MVENVEAIRALLQALRKAEAPLPNISAKPPQCMGWFTDETSQPLRSWLKANALLNVLCMSVTEAVFHEPMGWLNAWAL